MSKLIKLSKQENNSRRILKINKFNIIYKIKMKKIKIMKGNTNKREIRKDQDQEI